jgi:kynurenine 3-monooxygenase
VTFPGGSVPIIGAGPTGTLLAVLLKRRGVQVTLYESRTDPRKRVQEGGRSINLALADRGIHALKLAGVFDQIEAALVPMRGRWVHQRDAGSSLQPYGQRANEIIFSISRRRLNQVLLDVAERREGVRVEFEHRLEHADFERQVAHVRNLSSDRLLAIPMQPLLATDGAGSVLRRGMAAGGLIAAHESALEHGYKELTIPPGPGGEHRMEREALHIWPRGDYMLIALPNVDGSFTATLFLPMEGAPSFASLTSPAAIERFLTASFSDVRDLMPNGVAEFQDNPTGSLGTVHSDPWHHRGMAALVGDSAHAIVPFHGQGMNCCFEDCVEFDRSLARRSSWESVFADFYATRKPNTDAIAAMAIENYLEMRERVVDPRFQLQRALALELERRFPHRFIPRYSMVMFHHEIPYRTALERGAVQEQLLAELTAGATALSDVDFLRAGREVELRLEPIAQDRTSVTKLNG